MSIVVIIIFAILGGILSVYGVPFWVLLLGMAVVAFILAFPKRQPPHNWM